ncbi:phytanoyl-CoA dioxygenase domain-containing protein 1-like isoform X2 [Gigantopelta aegis]|uniref:phytanoyl-CoA dioxygenase domain-containing protein 1-like isoform X2 n=1 Tax=Gigantopelta aegis TaxID=1735272 RepID=UPI001B888FBF|nr:phytanoyl-CoA dioxygenase domain-containing protein 1-like isoform X2 [Gigantopelta aegis]
MMSHKINKHPTITWPVGPTAEEWIASKPIDELRSKYEQDGYLIVNNILTQEEVNIYRDLVGKMLSGQIDTSEHRHDLGNHEHEKQRGVENITQIMWPSEYVCDVTQGPLHQRTSILSKALIGDDSAFDFDMMISKAPHTDTITPWHQDESYWPQVDNKKSVSFWTALDDAVKDNGCMWFVPGSHHKGLRPSRPVKEGCHVQMCDGSEDEGFAAEISAGSCTLHHGRTMHYTRGNSTDKPRRAFIVVYRPASMVVEFRKQGFDHGKKDLKKILNKTNL